MILNIDYFTSIYFIGDFLSICTRLLFYTPLRTFFSESVPFSVFFFHSIVTKFSASIKIIVIMALNELINRIVWVNFIAIKCTLPSKRAEELSTCVNLNRKSRPRTVLKLKIANRDVNKIGWRSKKAPLLSFYFK